MGFINQLITGGAPHCMKVIGLDLLFGIERRFTLGVLFPEKGHALCMIYLPVLDIKTL